MRESQRERELPANTDKLSAVPLKKKLFPIILKHPHVTVSELFF